MSTPGDNVGGFRLVRKLGEGPFGIVWHAQDPQSIGVALKLLKPAFIRRHTGQAAFTRLLSSIQLHRQLHHPGLAVVYGPVQEPQRDVLGMFSEYVDGRQMTEVRFRPMSLGGDERGLGRLLDWMIGLGDTLVWLHAHGVVHGNIKPSNVMLMRGPAGYEVKLLDLAWSAIGLAAPQAGEPTFLAPEQLGGAPPSVASDQWSWARLLERSLQGWSSEVDLAGVPEGVREGIRKATEENPAQRFSTLAELLERVRSIRAGLSVPDEAGGTPLPTFIDSPLVAPSALPGPHYQAPEAAPPYGYPPNPAYGAPPAAGYAPPAGAYPPGYGVPAPYPGYPPQGYPPGMPPSGYPYPQPSMSNPGYAVPPAPNQGYGAPPPQGGFESTPPVPAPRPGPQETTELPAMPRVRPLVPPIDTGDIMSRTAHPKGSSQELSSTPLEGSPPDTVPSSEMSVELRPSRFRKIWPIIGAMLMFAIGVGLVTALQTTTGVEPLSQAKEVWEKWMGAGGDPAPDGTNTSTTVDG